MRTIAIVLTLLSAISVCCGADEKAPASIIESALGRLMLRGVEAHPWVVFADSGSGQFVQFGYEKSSLFVDIPLVGTSEERRKRIERVFKSLGVDHPITKTARDPKTLKSFTIETYQLDFGKNAKEAGAFAMRVFREVYENESPTIETEEGTG